MEKKNLVEIMIRRKNRVILDFIPQPPTEVINATNNNAYLKLLPEESRKAVLATTATHNLVMLGYMPNEELFNKMLSDEAVSQKMGLYVLAVCEALKGANVKYHPMYPNFPEQVMEMDMHELYFNQFIHYISAGTWAPVVSEKIRLPLSEDVKLIPLVEGTEEDVVELFSNLLNSNIPYSPQDIADIKELAKHYDIHKAMPNFMTHRENLALLIEAMCERKEKDERIVAIKSFAKHIVSANDVARIMYTVYGDADATMTSKLKLKSISRAERKLMLELMEKCKHIAEDMKLRPKLWVRIGEILHPGEFEKLYPKTANAFAHIRDNALIKKVRTYNSLAEEAMTGGDIAKLSEFADLKPGVIARNLDRILRTAESPKSVLAIWKAIAPKVAPALLWTVHSHFSRRGNETEGNALRIFTVKSALATTIVLPDETKPIAKEICDEVVAITEGALREIYKEKPAMGKAYIAPEALKIKIPNETRGQQNSGMPMTKGSRIPMSPNAKTIRGFIWWTNTGKHRTDIDLSAIFLDENLQRLSNVCYFDLKNHFATHSGDFVDGGDENGAGVAEFIDIDVAKAKKQGVRYCVFTVHNYTSFDFNQMAHARFGYMEREESEKGKIFEPATVKQTIKLSAPSTSETMCMFDLETMEMIWIEAIGEDIFRNKWLPNNIDSTWRGTAMVCYKALHIEKPCVADVIRINAEARGGEIVANKYEADIVFSLEEGISPLDTDYFAGELIPAEVATKYMPVIADETEADTESVDTEVNN